MATLDMDDTADQAIKTLQGLIDQLNAAKLKAGADVATIVSQIETFENQQADLRDLNLGEIQETEENKQAIAAVSAAAKSLTSAAKEITDVASDLGKIAKVVNAAASLVKAAGKLV